MTCGDPADPNSLKMFDVKATEYNIHNIFSFAPFSTVHAHARVELKMVNEASGLLPLAVPDVRPRYVFATFIAESGTIACTDSSNNPVPSCEEQLVKGPVVSNQQQWIPGPGQQLKVTSSISGTAPAADVGVRIRLVGGTDPTATCGTLYTECYDAGSANGILHVRAWSSSTAAPAVRDASLLNGNCTPDAYFAAADCTAGITANIDLGSTHPVGQSQVWATVDGAGTYQLTVDSTSPGTGVHTWSLVQGLPISGGGPHEIRLQWKDTGAGGGNGNFGGQLIQRAFVAAPDLSGPLQLAQMFESGSSFGPYSYQSGTPHTLGVTVTTMGNLLLSRPTDPPIDLRVFKSSTGSASQNQSINCDPNLPNLDQELSNGCSPMYITNPALTCPVQTASALWAMIPTPLPCVPIKTGASNGQITHGLNTRIFGNQNGGSCSLGPVNWIRNQGFDETAHPNDKRVLPLIVTPLGTFSGNGTGVVPVIDFGYFYVTGYSGDPCEGVDPNQDPVPSSGGGKSFVRGHFIKFFPLDNRHTTNDNCDLQSITPCVGVLTR
jgi:hypothetical protein